MEKKVPVFLDTGSGVRKLLEVSGDLRLIDVVLEIMKYLGHRRMAVMAKKNGEYPIPLEYYREIGYWDEIRLSVKPDDLDVNAESAETVAAS
mgnify:CR=1 FL=1